MCVSRITQSLFSAILVAAVMAGAEAAESPARVPTLSNANQDLLQGLLKQLLFDPKGAQYVRMKTTLRTTWGDSGEIRRGGWLASAAGPRAARVFFGDGESIEAPSSEHIEKADFVADCRNRYAEPKENAPDDEESQRTIRRMAQTATGSIGEPDLVLAAWLYRLEQPDLAARALARARKQAVQEGTSRGREPPPGETDEVRMVRLLKEDLAWRAFAGLVHAYMVRADEEAISHGERLLRLYPDIVKKEYYQAPAIVGELKRRKAKGTFGKTPPEHWPEGFDSWDRTKRISWLIDALEEVDARQWEQPGGVSLGMDRRVAALIEIGDPAIPALIDAVEKDSRLTRSVHFWRDFSRSRTVLGVREAALTAAMSILKVRVFKTRATGDNFTSHGGDEAARTAQRLRDYWKTYGSLPYDERMMKTLTDSTARFEAVREAAENLGRLGEKRTLTTTVFSDWSGTPAQKPNPAVAKFSKPTVAEAILAAMDRDLAHHDAGQRDSMFDYERRRIEDSYLEPLVNLGDHRIAPELARRYRTATALRMRRVYATACHYLGDPEPLKAFAREVEKGSLRVPASNEPNTHENDQPGTVELDGIVRSLVDCATTECERALYALTAPDHPYHAMAVERVVKATPTFHSGDSAWLAHPFCLTVLRSQLNDTTPTGATWRIEGDSLKWTAENASSSGPIPEQLADPAVRRQQAAGRKCDDVALKLGELVVGIPDYNPLLKDAEARLVTMKRVLDRYRNHFRLATPAETKALGLVPWHLRFVPGVSPLGRPATAEDLEKGLAVFHLDGKGKVADIGLPAVATLRRRENGKEPPRVLVLQAEVGQDGKTTFGIAGAGDVRAAAAEELADVKPIAQRKPGKGK